MCQTKKNNTMIKEVKTENLPQGTEVATFGAGCFWCVEAVFQNLKGVYNCKSGYSGGEVDNPTYKQICTGTTGHAEVIQITYNPEVITFRELLEIFWQTHDPTSLNKQGNDVGTQYRSVIFYHSENQKKEAELYKQKLNDSNIFDKLVVTEISPSEKFYEGEDYHQNYYNNNSSESYCSYVIKPKMDKMKKLFADKLNP